MPHIHDKIDFTSDVFIVSKNKVLLRKHDKYKVWLSVGGHIELDEDPVQAAIREVKEEVGLKIIIPSNLKEYKNEKNFIELIPPKFMNRHRINDNHEHVSFVYFAKALTEDITENAEKSEGLKWFTLEDLEDKQYELRENIKFYAREALLDLGEN
jgi:ADP-ribose pyrophosphatase YjhB (NUDIX family)